MSLKLDAIVALAVLAALSAGRANAGDVRVILQAVKSERPAYELGEEVKFVYAVKNTGRRPITYAFSSSKRFDLWIRRGGKEVFRFSKGRLYAQMICTLKLDPGETSTFEAKWNQKDADGREVGPGVYEVHAQLSPARNAPPPAAGKVQIGGAGVAVVPVSISEAIKHVDELKDKRVRISATYRGWQPNPGDPNTKDGPPVTRGDWAICDSTGCMYVSGKIDLNPSKDLDRKVAVIGKLAKTVRGRVYLVLESATIEKKAS